MYFNKNVEIINAEIELLNLNELFDKFGLKNVIWLGKIWNLLYYYAEMWSDFDKQLIFSGIKPIKN